MELKIIDDLPLVYGADPEFRIKVNGNWERADSVIEDMGGTLGLDGNNATGEMRLGIGSVMDLFLQLAGCMITLATNGIEVYGGAFQDGAPIGGHIHVNFCKLPILINNPDPENVATTEYEVKIDGKTYVTPQMVRAIRDSLSIANEFYGDSAINERRRKAGYGLLKSVRYQSNTHLEFREPLSWIHHPLVALFYLSLTVLAAHNPDYNDSLLYEVSVKEYIEKVPYTLKIPKSIVSLIERWDLLVKAVKEVDFTKPANKYWYMPGPMPLVQEILEDIE